MLLLIVMQPERTLSLSRFFVKPVIVKLAASGMPSVNKNVSLACIV